MPLTSTNHGLSVATNDTNRRLALPLPTGHVVTNRFNDTGSQRPYQALGQHAHKGLDWDCDTGTEVYAMYEGKIAAIRYLPGSLGLYVIIRSSTGRTAGFEHAYAHLSEIVQIADRDAQGNPRPRHLRVGDEVGKGDLIGYSGNTGSGTGEHLHVQLQPFDNNRRTTAEEVHVDPTFRIKGYMNFECFLPSTPAPAISLDSNGTVPKLLSLKDTVTVNVYEQRNTSSAVQHKIPGGGIGCYPIVDQHEENGTVTWWKIKYDTSENGNSLTGWVQVQGKVHMWEAGWVRGRIETADVVQTQQVTVVATVPQGTPTPVPAKLQVHRTSVKLRPKPSTDVTSVPIRTLPVTNRWYDIVGSYSYSNVNLADADTCSTWWRIQDPENASAYGWMREM